jgi:hypothetical protein
MSEFGIPPKIQIESGGSYAPMTEVEARTVSRDKRDTRENQT